jgi:ribosome-interacting GTPase 1
MLKRKNAAKEETRKVGYMIRPRERNKAPEVLISFVKTRMGQTRYSLAKISRKKGKGKTQEAFSR